MGTEHEVERRRREKCYLFVGDNAATAVFLSSSPLDRNAKIPRSVGEGGPIVKTVANRDAAARSDKHDKNTDRSLPPSPARQNHSAPSPLCSVIMWQSSLLLQITGAARQTDRRSVCNCLPSFLPLLVRPLSFTPSDGDSESELGDETRADKTSPIEFLSRSLRASRGREEVFRATADVGDDRDGWRCAVAHARTEAERKAWCTTRWRCPYVVGLPPPLPN